MNAGHIIFDLETQLRNQFAELADLKEKLLDTQVELNAAYDRMAEPDLVIHHYHFTEDES